MANSGQRCRWFCAGGANGRLLAAVLYRPLGLELVSMTKDEALKLALEALDIVKLHYTQNRHVNEAITAIKEALAQPALNPSLDKFTELQTLVITGYTGVLACNFENFHADVEKRLNSFVFTHQFGNKDFSEKIVKNLYRDDFLRMTKGDTCTPPPREW